MHCPQPVLGRSLLVAFASLLASLLVVGPRPAEAADLTFINTANGRSVSGTQNGNPRSLGYAGTFNVQIDGMPPNREAYCVDINNGISPGDTIPQAPVDYPVEVLFILNNLFPQPNAVGTPLASVSDEAAAVQSAIWSYTDNFVAGSPSNVAARAAEIVAAANAAAPLLPTTAPQSIALDPSSATNILPGDASHTVTATLYDGDGSPLAGFDISLEVVSGPGAGASTSGASPSVGLTYGNTVPGSDVIEASTVYQVPTVQKFKTAGKQGIVLAGLPTTGTVTGTASKSWVSPTCGNGVTEPGEACDDGNSDNTDSCRNDCTAPECGDGFVQPGEECDDGNQSQNDSCKNDCSDNVCGDQFVNPGAEECDDGNPVNDDGCTNACHSPACGDGILQTGEECDDGNAVDDDGCTNTCTVAVCGDGVVQAGEECDDGNTVDDDACTNACAAPICGDGIVQAGEQCDDGNSSNDDGCTNACNIPACGDGIVQSPEECDDGNTVDDDGCTNACTSPVCGDGVVQAGEACDDGDQIDDDECTNACTVPVCGDGIVQSGEQCDDGDPIDDDECSNACTLPVCGDGILQAGEECDDGNNLGDDGCTFDCRLGEICTDQIDNDGDGLIDCDDPECGCLQISTVCKHPCPGRITFRPKKPGHDKFGFQASFSPTQPIDPSTTSFGVTITNANGIVWSATLAPGEIDKIDVRYLFRDKTARKGPGTHSGLYQLRLKEREPGVWRINVRAFADLSAATLPDMTIQIVVGNEAFERSATWKAVKKGWRVKMN